jgi:septal ring factor EnvC (AmiA/AmiB activator)
MLPRASYCASCALLTCTLLLCAAVVQAFDKETKKRYCKEHVHKQREDAAVKAMQAKLQRELNEARKEIQALK